MNKGYRAMYRTKHDKLLLSMRGAGYDVFQANLTKCSSKGFLRGTPK
jgi:hypothetical protein